MARILRMALIAAALYAAVSYYLDDPEAARKNVAELRGRAGALSEQAPEVAEGLGDSVEEAKQSASAAKNRLDTVREKVESSIEAGRDRVAKSP